MYGTEVPAYNTLVDVSTAVNADFMAAHPDTAERLGRIDRVTAERHGAIRVGTASELRRVAQIFAALGISCKEDNAGAALGGTAGNLFARVPGTLEDRKSVV